MPRSLFAAFSMCVRGVFSRFQNTIRRAERPSRNRMFGRLIPSPFVNPRGQLMIALGSPDPGPWPFSARRCKPFVECSIPLRERFPLLAPGGRIAFDARLRISFIEALFWSTNSMSGHRPGHRSRR